MIKDIKNNYTKNLASRSIGSFLQNEHQIEVYLLKDGKYELDNVYTGYAAHVLEDMTEKRKI